MTTATLVDGNLTMDTVKPRHSLEELVDRLMATLTFREEPATAAANSLEGAMPVSTSRSRTMRTVVCPRRSLEELVDRLMAALTFREEPATAAANSLVGAMPVVTSRSRTMRTVVRPQRSLEELVDRLMAALTFREEPESPVGRDSAEVDVVDTSKGHSVVRAIHEARRLRQAADLDGALETLAGADMTPDDPNLARWTHSEWKQLVKRQFGHRSVLVYNQGTGRAAALTPLAEGGMLEVVAALGMRWRPGKIVSRRP